MALFMTRVFAGLYHFISAAQIPPPCARLAPQWGQLAFEPKNSHGSHALGTCALAQYLMLGAYIRGLNLPYSAAKRGGSLTSLKVAFSWEYSKEAPSMALLRHAPF